MELLDKHINLVQVHDLIGDSMINYIKNSSIGFFKRATTDNTISDYRTAAYHFLPGNSKLNTLEMTISRITGLIVVNGDDPNSHASEDLQVASSTFGGHYKPHYDKVSYNYLYYLHGLYQFIHVEPSLLLIIHTCV